MRKAIAILWPSFIFGVIGTVLFFRLVAAGSSRLTTLVERGHARR